MEIDLGEVLDPFRRHVIDIRMHLLTPVITTMGRSDIGVGLGLQGPRCPQEIFPGAGEKLNVVDDMLDELYRQLSDVDRVRDQDRLERRR